MSRSRSWQWRASTRWQSCDVVALDVLFAVEGAIAVAERFANRNLPWKWFMGAALVLFLAVAPFFAFHHQRIKFESTDASGAEPHREVCQFLKREIHKGQEIERDFAPQDPAIRATSQIRFAIWANTLRDELSFYNRAWIEPLNAIDEAMPPYDEKIVGDVLAVLRQLFDAENCDP